MNERRGWTGNEIATHEALIKLGISELDALDMTSHAFIHGESSAERGVIVTWDGEAFAIREA